MAEVDRVTETLDAAGRALSTTLTPVGDPLPTSPRNLVLRARRPNGETVIVERYLTPGPFFQGREARALRALFEVGSSCVPTLLATTRDLVVLSDVGSHGNLADALLGADAAAARDALISWASTLGQFHLDGSQAVDRFNDRMVASSDYMLDELTEAAAGWRRFAADLGVPVPSGLWDTLPAAPDRFRTPAHGAVCRRHVPGQQPAGW